MSQPTATRHVSRLPGARLPSSRDEVHRSGDERRSIATARKILSDALLTIAFGLMEFVTIQSIFSSFWLCSIASAAASRRNLVLHAASAALPPTVCQADADLILAGLLKELAATAVGTSNRALIQ